MVQNLRRISFNFHCAKKNIICNTYRTFIVITVKHISLIDLNNMNIIFIYWVFLPDTEMIHFAGVKGKYE